MRTEMVRRGADFLSRFERIEEKEGALEALVRIQVLAQLAREEGFADRASVREALDGVLAERFWRAHVDSLETAALTPEVVRAEYDANPDRYTETLRARGALLRLRAQSNATREERAALRTRAEALQTEAAAADDAAFASLVRSHSDDLNTRERGGDMGFVAEGASVFRFEREVLDALFAISSPGGTSEVVETQRGFTIVRLTATHGGKLAPFTAVEPDIRRRLAEERLDEALDAHYAELRSRFDVEVDRELLATLGPRDLAAASRPPSFPAGDNLR